MTATFGAASYSPSQFVGTTPSYAEARKSPVDAGTFITAQEEAQHARVVVLGQTVVENLFGDGRPARTDGEAERHRLRRRRRAHVEGNERLPGSGRHRDRAADDDPGLITGVTTGLSQIIVEAKSSGR